MATDGVDDSLAEYLQTCDKGSVSTEGYRQSLETTASSYSLVGLSSKAAAIGMQLFNAALNIGIMLAVTAVIEGLVKVIDNYVHRTENMVKSSENAKAAISDINSEFEEHKKTIEEASEVYKQFAKGVDLSTNKNLSLSTEQYQSFIDAEEQIAKIFPEATSDVDDNGHAILNLGNNAEEAAKKLQTLIDAEKLSASQKIEENLPDLFKGIQVSNENLDKAIEDLDTRGKDFEHAKELLDDLTEQFADDSNNVFANNNEFHITGKSEVVNPISEGIETWYKNLSQDERMADGVVDAYQNLRGQIESGFNDYDASYDFYLSAFTLDADQQKKLQQAIHNSMVTSAGDRNNAFQSLQDSKKTSQTELDNNWMNYLDSLDRVMKSKATYFSLEEENPVLADMATSLVKGLNSSVSKELDANNPYQYIQDHIVTPLSQIDDAYIQNKMSKLLSFENGDMDAIRVADEIQQAIKEKYPNIELDLTPIVGDEQEAKEKLDSAIENILKGSKNYDKDLKRMQATTKDFSADTIEEFISVVGVTNDADEAIRKWDEHLGDVRAENIFINALDNMTEKLNQVTDAKTKYDEAMQGDDYNTQFKNYADAFDKGQELIANGDYGKHFRETMAYMFGDEAYYLEIDKLKEKMEDLKVVFDDADSNGYGFLEKMYELQSSGKLDGIDASIEKLSDGGYNFDIPTTSFKQLADAMGMTEEEVSACIYALGEFGDYTSMDLEQVQEALNGIKITAESTGKSFLSFDYVEQSLKDAGYAGSELNDALQTIQEKGDVNLLHFSSTDAGELSSIVSDLETIAGIDFTVGDNIDIDTLISTLKDSFGMTQDEIQNFVNNLSINWNFTTKDDEGKTQFLEDADALQSKISQVFAQPEDNGIQTEMENVTIAATDANGAVQNVTLSVEDLNNATTGNILSRFNALNQIAEKTKINVNGIVSALNNSKIPSSPTSSSQAGVGGASGGVFKGGKTLVGEIGQEMVVDPNTNTWTTVGDNGAEFVNLPKDAIVFNNEDTKRLLSQGKTNGKALASGNAYASGSTNGQYTIKYDKDSEKSSSSSDKSSSDKSDADNAIDWIERKIKILQDKRSELETLMDNTYTMYTGLTKEEVDRVTELLNSELSPGSDAVDELCDLANKAGMSIGELQQRIFDGAGFESKQSIIAGYILNDQELLKTYPQAIAQYESEYEKAIALVADYRDKIENGSIDVESISDETTHDNVQKAIDARDKVTDARSSYAETQQKLNDDIILKYDTQIEQCEKINDLADKRISLINAQVDYLEEEGQILDASAYNGLIGLYKEQEATISKQIEIKKAELQELLNNGLSEDTPQYMDLNSEIVDLEVGLVNCATSQEELNNKLIQLPIDNIQKAVDLYSDMQTAIEDFGSVTEASGGTLDASYYQSLIDLGQEQIGQLEQQADAIRDAMSNYDTDNTHYIDLASQLSKVTSSIQSIVKSMYEWNEAILQLPISHLNNALGVLQGIQDKLTDTISLIEAQGGVATKGMYEDLIAGSQAQERYYVQLKDFYQQSLDYAEEDSEQYYDLVKNIQECDTNINKCNQDQVGWNKAILNIPIDVVDKYNEKLQSVIDSINDIMDDYGTTISAVTGAIDDQKQALQEANDATHDAYDARIQELQDQLDALRKVNEALQYQTDLEQALYDLEKVTNQKTVAVIINGQKQYVADADALRDAEQSVADAQEALNEYNIQSQIDDLNDMLGDIDDVYNDQIEALERISNKWSEIASKAEQTKNETLATTILGEGWKNKVLTGNDDDIFNEFVSSYNDMFSQQNNYQEQIDANNHLADQIQRYMDAYESGDMDFNQAYQAIQNATNNISSSVSSFDKLSDVLSFYNSGNLSGVLSELENSMKEANNSLQSSYSSDLDTYLPSFDGYLNQLNTEFSEALQQTIDNNNLIGTYKTTWDIVSDNISDIKDIVEEINDAVRNGSDYLEDGELENDIETANSNSSNSSSSVTDYPSGHVISGHSYTHVVTGVNGGPGVSYKDGIENGLIGSGSTKNNETKMKILGLRKLDPQEIPALMHLNEAVFNPTQQNQLLENFGRAYNAGAINAISSPTSGVNVNLNMSNLEFNEINNGQDFANFITKNLSSAIAQGLAK